jgi:hypothetical protein
MSARCEAVWAALYTCRVSLSSELDRSTIGPPDGAAAAGATPAGHEEHDALPVLADRAIAVRSYSPAGALSRATSDGVIPIVQAAAVAAGGFVAGAAFVGLAHRRGRRASALAKGRGAGRRLGRGNRAGRSATGAGELIQIVGSRSLLVDVHLLGGR